MEDNDFIFRQHGRNLSAHHCASCPACDFPTCIGGECMHECERQERHERYLKEDEKTDAPPAAVIGEERS